MSSSQSTSLGGSGKDLKIAKIGYGLMGMSWTPRPTPDEQAFEAIKTAIECTPADQKLFINSGDFYGINPREANLQLINRFFTKYPDLADRCFLSVKGGISPTALKPDSSPANIRRSVNNILTVLDGKKKLDLYECARVDPDYTLEEVYGLLKQLQSEGKFDHIGISEVGGDTLKKVNAIVPIAAVEIEVIEVAKDLGIAVVAYSPLGSGFFTGKVNVEELPEGDVRRRLSKFQDEARAHNQKLLDALTAIAEKKGITNAQLSLAWVSSLGPHVIPLPGSSKASRVKENFAAGEVTFTREEFEEIRSAMEQNKPKGGRLFDGAHGPENLWA